MAEDSSTVPTETEHLECATYSVKQTSQILGMGLRTAYEAVERGDIKSIRFGRLIRVPKWVVHQLVEQ